MPILLLAAFGLGLLSLAAMSDVLFAPGDAVISHREADTFFYFARARRFAASQILQGNFPLWNPHVFSGLPFFGDFQSAMLYPPNVIYLILPLAPAINLDVALHVFLMGLFTYAWIRNRRVHGVAAFYGGVVMMFCGAVSVRVLAGQLTVLAAACWTPLILLVVDRLHERPTLGVTLVGIAAVTLQVLAGYPFYVFATALIIALYALLRLPRCEHRARTIAALAGLALAPPLLSAVQLWTGIATGNESLRAAGVDFSFVTSFSLTPENFLTSIAPTFFGDTPNSPYWGIWKYWDTTIFVGVTTVVLAVYGALRGSAAQKRFAPLFLLLMILLSLGKYTPLYAVLFEWVPGFDLFRAPSKFALQASLFVSLLAALGLDHWFRKPRGVRLGAVATGILALALLIGGVWIHGEASSGPDGGRWGSLVDAMAMPGQARDTHFFLTTARSASLALWIAAGTAGLIGLMLSLGPRARWLPYALTALGIGEVFHFAFTHHDRFFLDELRRPALEVFYEEHPGDYRVLDIMGRNHAMDSGALAVWGYDPVQLYRYGRFIASIQLGRILPPDYTLPIMVNLDQYSPRLDIVRCRYVIRDWSMALPPSQVQGDLPRLHLVGEYRVVPTYDVLRNLFDPLFEPQREVLLEEEPDPQPSPLGVKGRVRLVDESTDHVSIEVDLPAPAILVITDAYSTGWRVTAQSSNSPDDLRILPANFTLQAIPLPRGHHELRLEYSPAAYRIGAWVSSLSFLLFLLTVLFWGWRHSRALRLPEAQPESSSDSSDTSRGGTHP